MAISRLGYEIDSSQAKRAAVDLDKMTQSSERAEKSARDLTTATRTEATATGQLAQAMRQTGTATAQMERSIEAATGANYRMAASSRAATAAVAAQAVAANSNIRLTRAQMTGLGFQLNDIVTMLAMGASPFQIMASQGGQVVQVLGDGPGGMRGSLRALGSEVGSLATRLAPVGITIAALGTGVAALRSEINETSDTVVSFGDVSLAVWQMMRDGFLNAFQGPIQTVQGWWKTLWENVESFAVNEFNNIARNVAQLGAEIGFAVDVIQSHWEGSVTAIKTAWELLPGALGDIVYSTANRVIEGVEGMVQKAIDGLNNLMNKYALWRANIGSPLDPAEFNGMIIGPVEFGGLDNQWEGQAGAFMDAMRKNASDTFDAQVEAFRNLQDRKVEIAAWNPFEDLTDRATENALRDVEEAATDAGGAIGRAANDNKDAWAGLRDVTEEANGAMEQTNQIAQSIGSTIADTLRQGGDLWDAFKEAGLDAVAKIGEAWITSGIQQMLGGFGGGGGGFWSNLFSWLPFANGAAFDRGNVIPFAAGGVVSGPTAFPMAGGRTGLMGEAGPEAIMPLRRGRDGRLGVAATNQNQPAQNMLRVEQHFHITGAVSSDDVQRMVRAGASESVQVVKDSLPGWQTDIQLYGRPA